MKVTVALAPLASPPKSQLTGTELVQVPDEATAERRTPVDGIVAVRAMLVDADGPAFLMVAV
jgi:hypothetical protein